MIEDEVGGRRRSNGKARYATGECGVQVYE